MIVTSHWSKSDAELVSAVETLDDLPDVVIEMLYRFERTALEIETMRMTLDKDDDFDIQDLTDECKEITNLVDTQAATIEELEAEKERLEREVFDLEAEIENLEDTIKDMKEAA
jgi:peptidoglycan hydrolase CwlO-like protein